MPNYPQPKSPKTALRRAEMMKQRYEALKNGEANEAALEQQENNERAGWASSDSNIPKKVNREIKKRVNKDWNDVEPAWRSQDPRKRMSWQEFCRDFMGQNYGAIAQDLLKMHNSDDPYMNVQFMKFMMEMGKQGNPQSLQLDVNASMKVTSDIYAQLAGMTKEAEPEATLLNSGEQQLLESGEPPVQDLSAEWNTMQTEDNPFATEEEQQAMYNPDGIPYDDDDSSPSVVDPQQYEDLIDNQFPPLCPHCGSPMVWQSDFMLSETGYIDADQSELDENGIAIDDR